MLSNKFAKRCTAAFSAACCMLMCIPLSVTAETNTGSITLVCETENRIVAGMEWSLYRVGSRNADYDAQMKEYEEKVANADANSEQIKQPNLFITEGSFKSSPVNLNVLSEDTMPDIAQTLENEAVVNQYQPQLVRYTDDSGWITFADMPQGLYLLSGKRMLTDEYIIIPSPVLVEIVSDDYFDQLNIHSEPKIRERVLSESESEHAVRKVWLNDENSIAVRSTSITVNIYKDGALYETKTLNESNDWEYTWFGDDDAEWRVQETIVPEGYTVRYLANDVQFVIENTYTPWIDLSTSDEGDNPTTTTTPDVTDAQTTGTQTETTAATDGSTNTTDLTDGSNSSDSTNNSATTSTTDTTPGLPQTGQLWWPVPILGVGGILFLMIGWRLSRREEEA